MSHKSAATRAVERALDFQERLRERLRKEMEGSIGYEQVSTKEIRSLARLALEGDEEAMAEIWELAKVNGHQPGVPGSCPVCREVDFVLQERMDKVMDKLPKLTEEEASRVPETRPIEDVLATANMPVKEAPLA